MKENTKNIIGRSAGVWAGSAARVKSGLVLLAVFAAGLAGAQTFTNALALSGDFGNTVVDNSSNMPEAGAPSVVGLPQNAPVWFQWTASESGPVEFDTIGSLDDVLGVFPLQTAMAVYTGTNLTSLSQLAANENLYPEPQVNDFGQNVFDLDESNNPIQLGAINAGILQPYEGPSCVRFNAVAGVTYDIVVDTEGLDGNISLNWGMHPSGVVRFATEKLDEAGGEAGMTYPDGTPPLLYEAAESETSDAVSGTVNAGQYASTLHTTYEYNVPGVLVTVTRVAGSSGRIQVGYQSMDINTNTATNTFPDLSWIADWIQPETNLPNLLLNGDTSAVAGKDYTPVNGLLTFDDSEISKTIFIPITDHGANYEQRNCDFLIVVTNVALDPTESLDVEPPRQDPTFSTALVRILNNNLDPKGLSDTVVINSTVTPATTNLVFDPTPTNVVVGFSKVAYRVSRDVTNYWQGTPITVYVNRYGTNEGSSPTVYWSVDAPYLDKGDVLADEEFPLQAASDYATPDPANSGNLFGAYPDFDFPGGYSGTLSWGSKVFTPQPITFTVYGNGQQRFAQDLHITLYEEDSNGNPIPAGMVGQATVTILFNDLTPPAGSVDEFYNADFSYQFAQPFPTVPQEMTSPGVDGEAYGVAVQPDNKSIIVGQFDTYDQSSAGSIVRANTNGTYDTTFNAGGDGISGYSQSFISCVLLSTNNEILIGGYFTAYNGESCKSIALLQTNGALDTTFSSGLGFNGPVYAMVQQPNGQILVGGDFTSYNGATANYIVRLNLNGTLDSTFNSGTNLNGQVSAITLETNGEVAVGGSFTTVNGVPGQNYITLLQTNGLVDSTFDPGSGANGAVLALATQPDGNIVMGGGFSQVNGQSFGGIARLTPSGSLDPNFFCGSGVDGTVNSITVNTNVIYSTTNSSVVVQTNFTIYVGGSFTMYNGTHRLGFARVNADGTVDTTFLDTAYNEFAGLPRDHYGDPLGTVLASAIQSDGNVMIAGSFNRVGGGQSDDPDVRPENVDSNNLLVAENSGYYPERKTRAGVRNRSNVARLIGGATPGPGNVGLLSSSYSIGKSQGSLSVSLIRTNGYLGPASANFSLNAGTAQNGVDYDYFGAGTLDWIDWEYNGPSRMHSDGLFGTNGFLQDAFGHFFSGGTVASSSVNVTIFNSTNSLSNLSAQLQMANPANEDQLYLGGQDIPLGVGLGVTVAPLSLIEDQHQAGTFGFLSSTYTATNNTSAAISVTRTNGTFGTVSMSFQTVTNGSTAVLNSDYRSESNVKLTFAENATNATVNVPVLQTNYSSPTEKFVNLQIYNLQPPVDGLASFGLTNAILRIINPNFQGFLDLATNAYSTNMEAGAVTVTVTRTVGSKGTLYVDCGTTNGTATNGVDYVGSTNLLVWNSGDVSSRNITIPLLNNGTLGGDRTFGVWLFNATNNQTATPSLLGTITNATITISNDNSLGSFQLNSSGYIVDETAGFTTITVIRTGSTNGTAQVNFTTADSSAFAGTNYVATNGVLTFLSGQLSASFNVQILNDGVVDPPPSQFYFTVALTNSSPNPGTTLLSPTNANVEIVDAQSFTTPPGAPDTTFATGLGMNGAVLALALQTNAQIIAGGDFTTVNGALQSYLARINPDGTLDYSFPASINGPVYSTVVQTDGSILVAGTFTEIGTIVRNGIARLLTDGTLDSSFNPGSGADNTVYALAESFLNGSRVIYAGGQFSLMNGFTLPNLARLNEDGSVDTSFNTGTGGNGSVYAIAVYPTNSVYAGELLIGGAFTSFNGITVPGVARLYANGSVDTNFAANASADAAVRAVTIQDDGRILIGGDFTNVDGVVQNHIARLNADGTLDTNFVANAGAGINGTVDAISLQQDNSIVVAGQFTGANGLNRNSITRLQPSGLLDPTINFGTGANGAINAVVIQPNDQNIVIGGGFTQYDGQTANYLARIYGGSETGSGTFQFSSANYQVDENGVQAVITVQRLGGTSGANADGSGDILVPFATSAGTATPGLNYSNISVSLDFPPGENAETVVIPVYNSSNITPDLTVNMALSSPTAPATLGDQSTAQLLIINDNSAVSFSSPSYSVSKNVPTGFGLVNVVRLGSTVGTTTVGYTTTTNGTATAGTDYYPTNGTVTFGPGDSNEVVQVPIINNNILEPNETVILALTNAQNAIVLAPSNTTLTIINTVNSPGQLDLASPSYTVGSGDGYAYITVLRTNGTSGAISVTYTSVPGTAQPGINYQSVNNTLSFNDGDTSKTFSIPIINNPNPGVPTAFSVYLSNPTDGATLISPTNATVTINNTNVGIAFIQATNVIPENAGTLLAYVERYGNTNTTASVYYATVDGTASSGLNYVATSGTLTFAPGQVLLPISVSLLYDNQVTGDLFFNIALSNPQGAQILTPAYTVVDEQDADAGLSFTNSTMNVYKNAGSVLVTVVCSNSRVEPPVVNSNSVPLSVGYSTANGTAIAGQQYTAVTGTLLFTNGIGTNTFSVPIINNGFVTGDTSFSVVLTNATAPGQITPIGTENIVIKESNAGLTFSSPNYSVYKNGLAAGITVNRVGYTNNTVSVNFFATNGTAINGQNYTATNGTLVFTNGVLSQQFFVPLIVNNQIQPNLTVLLQLLNPTNSVLVSPSAATLTILENGGGYVIPSGSALVSGNGPVGGVIYAGETVQVLFGLRDSAGLNVTNLIAYLLATNGVTGVSPGSQDYGPLAVYGHSASEPFTFTAQGTNGTTIEPTFDLYDNSKFIGTAAFTFSLGTTTNIFVNTNAIVINDDAAASPYPSVMSVSGVGGSLVKATVTFNGLTHASPSDIEALVVSPSAANTLLMANVGGQYAVKGVVLTFDDGASNSLPQNAQIFSGTNKPTEYPVLHYFP